MTRRVNIVTVDTSDDYVHSRFGVLEGICMDIWRRIANDLDLSYSLTIADNWVQMFNIFRNGSADVIVQTIDVGMLMRQNCSR